ncbi:MAG: hypothetical protein FJ104_03480 [Deltaproteobacteria bacterium]|nr:hypothetical protein [Deltaproteobacteria bacterium]
MRSPLPLRALALLAAATPAAADPCAPRGGQAPCLDVDRLWVAPGPSALLTLPELRPRPALTWSLGADAGYVHAPLRLRTEAPDPAGRELRAVTSVSGAALSATLRPTSQLELGVAQALVVAQEGTGLVGVTRQRGEAPGGAALRDTRLGVTAVLADRAPPGFGATLALRAEVTLPTGDETRFAGAPAAVFAPGLGGELRAGRVTLATLWGVRLGRQVPLGGQRLGSVAVASLGVAVDLLPRGALALAAETWVLPELGAARRTTAGGGAVTSQVVAAEWLAGPRARRGDWELAVAGGTALPFSSETVRDADGATRSEVFAAPGTPLARVLLRLRFVPGSGIRSGPLPGHARGDGAAAPALPRSLRPAGAPPSDQNTRSGT